MSNACKNCSGNATEEVGEGCSYEMMQATAEYLRSRIPQLPKIFIICGTGMGSIADNLKSKVVLPYSEVPNFPVSTVPGHTGELVFGFLSNVYVVCMKGRFHYFEGYPLWKCTLPVRVMKLLGVEFLIASNAAGGINTAFQEGDVMLFKDHINFVGLSGASPLQGPNDERWGPRFPSMSLAYDADIIAKAKDIWREEKLDGRLFEGVYCGIGGPAFETVAEIRYLHLIGADAVGMSTVHEATVARHCNMTVFAFSLITNMCTLNYGDHAGPKHEEVLGVGGARGPTLCRFIEKIVDYIAKKRIED